MKGLIATLGVLSLLATVPATAESLSGEKGFVPLFPAGASVDDQTNDNRINIIKRMRDDGLPKRRFSPQVTFVAEDVPKQRTRSPYARSPLFEDVQFRSDGNLGDRIADQYDGFGRSLSTRMLGEKRGENVRFKRVDDGVGISIDFD
jgi:hypothetical protein